MRRTIGFILLAAIVVGVAWWVALLPGDVAIEVGDLSFQAHSAIAVVAVAVLVLLLYMVVSLLLWLLRTPARARGWRLARHRRTGDEAVTRTLLALAAGETVEAQREASKARRLLGDTPQTLLLAAEAGRLAGDDTAATAAFKALTAREDASFLGYRGLLRRAMEQEDWSEAASLARSAEAAHPGAAWLRGERRQLAIRTGNWNEALALAGPDSPKAALAVAAAEADPDAGRALRTAKRAWREAPDNPAATLAFARRLRAAGKERRAQAVIRRGWTLSPQPDLAAFALSGVMAGPSRLAAAKQLVVETPTALESRMLLAREMLDAGEAVNAKAELEAARDAGADQRRLWVLLAEVEERLGAADAAGEAWRRAARASADSAWRCDSCGAEAPRWQPVCAACGKIGTLRWSAHSVGSVIIPPATSVTTVS